MYIDSIPSFEHGTLKFSGITEHVTDKMLEEHYSDRFRMFDNRNDALEFSRTQPHAWISRVVDYRPGDVRTVTEESNGKRRSVKAEIIAGAQPYTKGWLVSLVGMKPVSLGIKKNLPNQ